MLAWVVVVWSVHRPWRDLGGIVDERLRWAERLATGLAVWTGIVVGDVVRDRPPTRRRLALWPPTIAAGLAVPLLELAGRPWIATLVAGAWLAYVAGIDVSSEGRRLLDGRSPDEDRDSRSGG